MSLATDVLKPQIQQLDKIHDALLAELADLNINNPALQVGEVDNKFLQILSTIQSTNTELHNLMGKVKKDRKEKVTIEELVAILKPFSEGSLIKENQSATTVIDSENLQLLSKLESLILSYSILIVHHILINDLLQSTIPLSDDLFYWDQTYSSTWKSILYSLQTLPIRSFNLFGKILNDLKSAATPNLQSVDVPELIANKYPQFINQYKTVTYYKHLLTNSIYNNIIANNIRGFYSLGIKSIVKKNPADYVSIMIGAPLSSIKQELKDHRTNITKVQRSSAEKLGALITKIPNLGSLNLETIHSELVHLTGSPETDDFILLSKALKETLPKLQKEFTNTRNKSIKPSLITRYWPTILLTLLYGPSTVLQIISNKEQIIEFIRLNLIDTIKGFWQNWILKPVNNILSTIRHDDSSEISIMSQNSLDSDLNSLKRMVIDYTIENSGESYTPEQISSLRSDLDKLVASGDLTPMMKGYENDIKKPLKNIISGKLPRALLIQLQKTKVDGAVAINGIDKLLKSQELVFGIVAASPSLIIVVYLLRAFNSYLTKGYVTRGSRERKLMISKNLNNIERLLNEDEGEYINGMLLLESYSLRKNGQYVIPKNRRLEWRRDVSDLNNGGYNRRLNSVKRIYNVYGQYFQ